MSLTIYAWQTKISEDIWLTSRDEEALIGRFGHFSESIFVGLDQAVKALDDDEQTYRHDAEN